MLETAKDIAMSKVDENRSSLENLADSIDSLDNKLTYGMLFIGAIAAIFNPIIGAGIAVKAVLPSISGLMTKHGLRPLGERFTRSQLEKQAKEAEESVIKQFSESSTLKVVNPILQQLDYALKTDEWEYDPLVDPNLFYGDIPELEAGAWPHLTEVAIYHVYKDIVEDQNQHEIYNLGPEDIRWLKLMFVGQTKVENKQKLAIFKSVEIRSLIK